MSDPAGQSENHLDDFDGTVRLFPLPNLVMFPHALQPLHVFEPRYRAMVADALAGDGRIAMVLLRPGWEADYHGTPPVFGTACLGNITAQQQLADGCYNLLLCGVQRVRILEELDTPTDYRVARAEPVADRYPPESDGQWEQARQRLLQCLRQLFPEPMKTGEQFARLLDSDIPLGMLVDILTYSLRLDVQRKQELLEEADVDARTRRIMAILEEALAGRKVPGAGQPFPPDFSTN